jgi:capsular exopolysaccharide synthesis family protein
VELRDYLNVIRARRGVIVLATIIVAGVALAVSLVQPAVYQSEARVLISEKDAGAALFGTVLADISSQPERALQTQVQLVKVRPVAEATIKQLGLEMKPDELLRRVTVTAVGQTNIIAIAATAPGADEAARIANAMADEYTKASRARKRESITAAADEVQQRLDQARSDILDIGRRVQSSGTSDELAAELQIATGTFSTLAEKLEQLRINEQLESGSGVVVQAAVAEAAPIEPRPMRNLALGLVVGLVFGLGMAFLYEYLDNTIKSTEEAEKVYGATVLGIVPMEKFEKGVKRQLTIVDTPGSSAAEAYRVIRNSLDFINFEHDLKSLLITSAAPAEGKSTVASNLAMSLVQSGKKVVLISCDFRRPTTDQFFSVNNIIGLSDVLLGTHSLKAALQQPVGDQLLVLTAGKMPPNANELLGSTKMQEVIASLEEWADWVLIDAPPVLAVADPVSVARWADGVLMVSKAGESTKEAAAKAVELLGKVGARIVGVAVWGLDEARNRSGYGYGYGYYTGGEHYYRSYYGGAPSTRRAKGVVAPADKIVPAEDWIPEPTPGRRVAAFVGRVMTGVLAFLVVIAIAIAVAYVLDQYFGWGIGRTLLSTVRL